MPRQLMDTCYDFFALDSQSDKIRSKRKKTAYAKSSQCRAIRKRMVEIMSREVTKCDLREAVNKL